MNIHVTSGWNQVDGFREEGLYEISLYAIGEKKAPQTKQMFLEE